MNNKQRELLQYLDKRYKHEVSIARRKSQQEYDKIMKRHYRIFNVGIGVLIFGLMTAIVIIIMRPDPAEELTRDCQDRFGSSYEVRMGYRGSQNVCVNLQTGEGKYL